MWSAVGNDTREMEGYLTRGLMVSDLNGFICGNGIDAGKGIFWTAQHHVEWM